MTLVPVDGGGREGHNRRKHPPTHRRHPCSAEVKGAATLPLCSSRNCRWLQGCARTWTKYHPPFLARFWEQSDMHVPAQPCRFAVGLAGHEHEKLKVETTLVLNWNGHVRKGLKWSRPLLDAGTGILPSISSTSTEYKVVLATLFMGFGPAFFLGIDYLVSSQRQMPAKVGPGFSQGALA